MKIWQEFNSSHSSNITVVGKFETPENLEKAYEMIEDFTLGTWEERHGSFENFTEHWSEKFHPDVKYIDIKEDEYYLGIDREPDFSRTKDTITISRLRHNNLGGLIKLLQFAGARKISIEQ